MHIIAPTAVPTRESRGENRAPVHEKPPVVRVPELPPLPVACEGRGGASPRGEAVLAPMDPLYGQNPFGDEEDLKHGKAEEDEGSDHLVEGEERVT